jgi:hypothetical protein
MQGVEHDETISIYAFAMQARRLLRRHYPSPLSPALTPRNDSSEILQQSRHWLLPGSTMSQQKSPEIR